MIKIEHLNKKYGDFTLDCSLEIVPGRVTGLVGPNGAGKSTTFKAVLGLITADGGEVTLLGKSVNEIQPLDKQRIGVVLSDSGFSGYLAVCDVIPVLEGMYEDFDKAFFMDLLKKFAIPFDKQIKGFSTGMKAKLKIIAAISHNAKLLILDEPTAGLDVIARDEVLGLLREYMEKDEERSILISSHISSDLEGICDDIYMINDGRIVLHEDTDILLSDYALLKLDEDQYESIDRQYILRTKKEAYGYSCLTNQRRFYKENYPNVVVENGTIDEAIMMIVKGEQ